MNPLPTKRCSACGSDIPVNCYLCPTCKEYQCRWRNELRYWSMVTGLVVVIATGISFTSGYLSSLWEYFFPPDLLVLDFDSLNNATFVNPSGQTILVEFLSIQSKTSPQYQWSVRWDIDKSIEPSKSITVNLVELAKNQFMGMEKEIFGKQQGPYVQTMSEKDKKGFFAYQSEMEKKYVPVFLKDGGTTERQLMKDIGKRVTFFPCEAEINYLFLQNHRERTGRLSCIGVIKHRQPVIQ